MGLTDRQLTRTAYHEAGHALLSHLQNFAIHSVTIVPDERCLGEVRAKSGALDDVAENKPGARQVVSLTNVITPFRWRHCGDYP
jgi:hypothetical protein